MPDDEERIALFLDYENLAIGAREALGGAAFDLRPVADALAERGRVVVRKAYADWSSFDDGRRMLTRHHVELIEIPQRMGATRKNAADIKMAVDAIELCFERDYITTFVLGTGDSDFTPLVNKLRELNRRVIGFGVEASTSALLPAACDEFLFYERLEGVESLPRRLTGTSPIRPISGSAAPRRRGGRGRSRRIGEPEPADAADATEGGEAGANPEDLLVAGPRDLAGFVTQTLAGMERSGSGPVRASMLKRAMLRKDPTFAESTYGFRAFGELLRHLAADGVISVADGTTIGDPDVAFLHSGDVEEGFGLLLAVVTRLAEEGRPVPLSGLKTQLRKVQPGFSEKGFGYNGFLQFCRAAEARALITMPFDEDAEDYLLSVVSPDGLPVADEVAAIVEETIRVEPVPQPGPEEPVEVVALLEVPAEEPAAPRRRRTARAKAVPAEPAPVDVAAVEVAAIAEPPAETAEPPAETAEPPAETAEPAAEAVVKPVRKRAPARRKKAELPPEQD